MDLSQDLVISQSFGQLACEDNENMTPNHPRILEEGGE